MDEVGLFFLVVGGFVGAIGLIAWLTRKNKDSGEDGDSSIGMNSLGTIDDGDSTTTSGSDSGGSDSGSSSSSC